MRKGVKRETDRWRIGIIGAGVVGTAFGVLAAQRQWLVVGVASRTDSSAVRAATQIGCAAFRDPRKLVASVNLLLVAVPDRMIRSVAEDLSEAAVADLVVLHHSGALTAEELQPFRDRGAAVGSLHPLRSLASVERAVVELPGSYFSVEGDQLAIQVAKELIDTLEGSILSITSAGKPLYHAAACLVSNYLVTLCSLGAGLCEAAGADRQQAVQALLPLALSTLRNIQELGIPQALTGPIARGDLLTVRRHLEAMALTGIDEELYCRLGQETLALAILKGGIEPQQMTELQALLST